MFFHGRVRKVLSLCLSFLELHGKISLSRRDRYDLLYDRFYAYKKESKTKSSNSSSSYSQDSKTEFHGFQFNDPILEKWILNAKNQALDFISKTYKDTKGVTKNGCKFFVYALGINIVLVILFSILMRACK